MDLKLTRTEFTPSGVFGALTSGIMLVAVTLEHAYGSTIHPGFYAPKLPAGVYTCVRGMHRLESTAHDFETFEITGVPGHTGILFHWGNKNADSAGCVLLGDVENNDSIWHSLDTFQKFMKLQEGCDSFILTVVDNEVVDEAS